VHGCIRSLNAIHCSYYKLRKVDEVAVVSSCMKEEVCSLADGAVLRNHWIAGH
jgi:hypothetical protein